VQEEKEKGKKALAEKGHAVHSASDGVEAAKKGGSRRRRTLRKFLKG